MQLGRPKALQQVFFRPMIHYTLEAAAGVARRSLSVVAGGDEDALREGCRPWPDARFFRQARPLGTGDAVLAAREALTGGGDVLVLYADTALLSAAALRRLLARHAETGAACTVGRADAGAEPFAWCFRAGPLLRELGRKAARLEDAAAVLGAAEYRPADPREAMDVDDFYGLCRVEAVLRERCNRTLMRRGVDLRDPVTTLIDPRCRIEPGVRIDGCCTVIDSVLERGTRLESFCRVVGCEIGPDSRLLQGTYAERARVGRGCSAGPYARLRPGTRLADDVRLDGFAELKTAGVLPI